MTVPVAGRGRWDCRRRAAWAAASWPSCLRGAIAVFSPVLDEAGNSVKAQNVIEYVADKLDLNIVRPSSVGLKQQGAK